MGYNGVAVTGMGIVSAAGMSPKENYAALLAGRSGISTIENFETIHNRLPTGEIKLNNAALAEMLGLPAVNDYSRTAMLGVMAANAALADAGLSNTTDCRTGLVSASSVGGMDTDEKHHFDYFANPDLLRYVGSRDIGNVTHKIAEALGIRGFATTISTACSSSANAVMLGARLIRSGRLDRVVVGGTDALSKFTVNGFRTLMILSDQLCQPFDNDRTGLNLGEAAAYLVLESDEMVRRRGARVLARVVGYANANDAFHQTASSDNGEGAYLAMSQALNVAGLQPSDISYINVHGTATPNNDLTEGRALLRIYGDTPMPPFSSTKPFTGHTLAAAAAVEAVYSILALQNDVVFPNLNFATPIADLGIIPATQLLHTPINHVLSNSFGFGGNCSTLIFSKA